MKDTHFIAGADGKSTGVITGDELLRAFNVSGYGGLYLYMATTLFRWTIEGNLGFVLYN